MPDTDKTTKNPGCGCLEPCEPFPDCPIDWSGVNWEKSAMKLLTERDELVEENRTLRKSRDEWARRAMSAQAQLTTLLTRSPTDYDAVTDAEWVEYEKGDRSAENAK